jgi:hypothetical protein
MTTDNSAPNGNAAAERERLLAGATRPRKGCFRTAIKAVLILIAATVVLVLIVSFGVDVLGTRRLSQARNAARDLRLPLTYWELRSQVWPSSSGQLPAEENAAMYYEAAFSLLHRRISEALSARLPVIGKAQAPDDPRTPLPDSMLAAARDFVSGENETLALRLVHDGAALPECQYSITWDGINTLLPHLTWARHSARILALKTWVDAEDGDVADAVTRVSDGLALSRSLLQEPMLISGLVGLAINSITLTAADRFFARTNPSAVELTFLQQQFSGAATNLSFRNNMIGELVFNQDTYERILDGRLPVQTLVELSENGQTRWPPAAGFRPLVWLERGYFKADQAASARFLMEIIDDASNPTPDVLSDGHERALLERIETSPFFLARTLLPALTKAIDQCERTRAKLRAAAACVAALRFRNDTGGWPDSLDALFPKYLTDVPLDPFTNAPLIYNVSENGVSVYSVGPNLADDGGKPYLEIRPPDTDENLWNRFDDAGFRIWK